METLTDFLEFAGRLTNYELRAPPRSNNAGQPHRFNTGAIERVLELCGHPQRATRARVLVAGTHGKGSTCHWIDGILRAAGMRTGGFRSHLTSVTERVLLDGQPVDEQTWLAAARQVQPPFQQAADEGLVPTFFDLVTAIALVAHRDAQVDVSILEVGLGGRLDSTNASEPTVTVITEIDLDHVEILGPDIELIAREKAGILRRGVPLVCHATDARALQVIRRAAIEAGADPVRFLGPEDVIDHPMPSPGHHQRRNAALASAAAREVLPGLDDSTLRRGLELAGSVPARCQPVRAGSGGLWILDAGHTPGSAAALATLLVEEHAGRPCAIVLGLARDKDAEAICRALASCCETMITTAYDSPRATPAQQLAASARACGISEVRAAVTIREALALADAAVPPEPHGLQVITGSFYLAGEILAARMLDDF